MKKIPYKITLLCQYDRSNNVIETLNMMVIVELTYVKV